MLRLINDARIYGIALRLSYDTYADSGGQNLASLLKQSKMQLSLGLDGDSPINLRSWSYAEDSTSMGKLCKLLHICPASQNVTPWCLDDLHELSQKAPLSSHKFQGVESALMRTRERAGFGQAQHSTADALVCLRT